MPHLGEAPPTLDDVKLNDGTHILAAVGSRHVWEFAGEGIGHCDDCHRRGRKLGKESPDARAAGVYAAKSLRIIAQTVHTVLLPLAAANYGAQRVADYMKERFGPELQERLGDVPEGELTVPRTVVAGPVLDSLVYAHDDDELRRLFLSLLSSSMDARVAATAHPAFVDVLRQIDSDEVGYLRAVLGQGGDVVWPIVKLDVSDVDGSGGSTVAPHLLDWRENGVAVAPDMAAAYVDNWVRLGLVEVSYTSYLVAEGVYGWGTDRPEYAAHTERAKARYGERREVTVGNGILSVTSWGSVFAKAVRIWDAPAEVATRHLGDWESIAAEFFQKKEEERLAAAAAAAPTTVISGEAD